MKFAHQIGSFVLAALYTAITVQIGYAVDYANVTVTDNAGNPVGGVPTVSIPAGQSTVANAGAGTEGFFVDSGAVVGEYPIRIGADATNDADSGVLINYVTENGRDYLDTLGSTETLFASSSIVRDDSPTATNTRGGSGGLSLVSDRSGVAAAESSFASGAPMNANLSAAYFPYSQGWVGGTVINDVGGSDFDQLVGSTGLSLGANVLQDHFSIGDHKVIIPGLTDTRRQGLLFTTHASNLNNLSVVSPTTDGTGFNVTTKSNFSDASGSMAENDTTAPFSFVYLPLGTPNITMASVHPFAGPNLQPVPMIKSGGDFTMTWDSQGTYRLSIAGQNPSSGTLLVQSTGSYAGTGGTSLDNIVTYEADGSDWLIQARDLPGLGLQNGTSSTTQRQAYFQFAFLPFNAPPTAPAAPASLNFTKKDVIAWNARVTEFDGSGNDNPAPPGTPVLYVESDAGTSGVDFQAHRMNKGDNGFSADGAFLHDDDGIIFATISEGLRDNSSTGGPFEYGMIAVSRISTRHWEFHTSITDPSNGEHNVDFAVALFGKESGFQMAAETPTAGGHLDLSLPGVDSLTDGVLMVTPYGNDDNFATVEPKSDGSGWDIDLYDNGTTLEGDSVNYVYLPYDTQNLVAGRVNEDGTLVNSTDTGEFTLVRDGPGEYLLTINGRTSDDGMLLLNGTGPNGSLDNYMVYEGEGNSFRILGLDMITSAESGLGELVDLEDTSFSFAFIDYITPPELANVGLPGDFDGDSDVDGQDFLVWQRNPSVGNLADWKSNYGVSNLASAAQAVPEPGALGLALCGLGLLGGVRRRHA